MNELSLWDITQHTNPQFHKIVAKETKLINAYCFITTSILVFSVVLFLIPDDFDRDVVFAVTLIETLQTPYNYICHILFRSCFPIIAYIMVMPLMQFIYFSQHIRLRIYFACFDILNNVDTIQNELDIKDHELYYDQQYQKEVRKLLIVLCNNHNILIR